ncbi:hypothetical protein B0H15DRAFT_823028 [Mycena belliarum]|uniref:Sulphur transport domain-containing protein n=1 Tax=Mycena belliarum TaxID=1033014 RepID=A0AAD6XUZ7_9AGAR|nr:hypothetical protein B0H15DRAFT_823028 [Mycena belliae]
MATSRPLHSFLGGVGLSLPVHALLLLNGNIFGVSGFLHRSVRGSPEAMASVLGLVLGGMLAGSLDGGALQPSVPLELPRLLLSGLLVGVGTKMANGCTSGHMIAGISRFSFRSITATAIFFSTGAITAGLLHGNSLPLRSVEWSLNTTGKALLGLQVVPLISSVFLYISAPTQPRHMANKGQTNRPDLRLIASLVTSFQFALALHLSDLTEPRKVVTFLLLPFHKAFDPSLAFLAIGALPVAVFLYQRACATEQPRLGGSWSVPKGGRVDLSLIAGAAVFGIGWGMSGFCPGPGLVNLGRALGGGSDPLPAIGWLIAVVTGGFLAGYFR